MADELVTLPDGRKMAASDYAARLELLSKPFAPNEIEKLPKQLRKGDDNRQQCRAGTQASADGHYCGGFHARSMHLDYIGHAGITDRLNQVDPLWTWEPLALTPHGTPLMSDGGMWGKLTVLGVSRIGFGDASGKTGPNAIKEVIGDFIRNAAMRFGVATYLWSKSESAFEKKRGEEGAHDDPAPTPAPTPQAPAHDWQQLFEQAKGNKSHLEALRHQARQMGAPQDFWLFASIEKQLASLPETGSEILEGKLL